MVVGVPARVTEETLFVVVEVACSASDRRTAATESSALGEFVLLWPQQVLAAVMPNFCLGHHDTLLSQYDADVGCGRLQSAQ